MAEIEIWKKYPDIDKFEVSSFGRVRSVEDHYYKILTRSDGYLQVSTKINGKQINKLVHRLVAETFIPNSNNLPQVNHLDCNKTNNNARNLEWCDNSYNQKYRDKFGISNLESKGHPLFAVNLGTLEVSHFRGQREASRALEVNQASISTVVRGKIKKTHGYWFVNDDGHAVDVVKNKLHDIGKTGLKLTA